MRGGVIKAGRHKRRVRDDKYLAVEKLITDIIKRFFLSRLQSYGRVPALLSGMLHIPPATSRVSTVTFSPYRDTSSWTKGFLNMARAALM